MIEIRLLSVNVSKPKYLGDWRGRVIYSSIAKQPIESDFLMLGAQGLVGDQQSDLKVHGGIDKAVYAYPSEHFPLWEKELGMEFSPGAFGENLTIAGAVEDDVRIGDQWRWGEAILAITKPRQPVLQTDHAYRDR